MSDKVIGMMWNRNEGDILDFTIRKALENVDLLYLADDSSTDNSLEIMKSFEKHPKVACVKSVAKPLDKRNVLLDLIRKQHRQEDTLVQVIESDITILDTDIRDAFKKYSNNNASMSWHLINATDPDMWADEIGCYPTWSKPIDSKMSHGHWMERLSHYTFRPLPGVAFQYGDGRPNPRGLGKYTTGNGDVRMRNEAPLLAHWGYRGPKHWLHKYNPTGNPNACHGKHRWKMGSVEQIKEHVLFFNGVWNGKSTQFPLSREGWAGWLQLADQAF